MFIRLASMDKLSFELPGLVSNISLSSMDKLSYRWALVVRSCFQG